MKTKNRVRKVIASLMIVIISSVLLNITVHAQKYWEMELTNNLNPIAFATFDDFKLDSELVHTDKTIKTNKADFLIEVETEKTLELESWMVDEKVFKVYFYEVDTEKPLELEDWMKNEKYFATSATTILSETEESLQLENWMIETKIWE